MNFENNKEILKSISDLENQIESFENAIKGMFHENNQVGDVLATSNDLATAPKDYTTKVPPPDVNKTNYAKPFNLPTNLQSQVQTMATNLGTLRTEVEQLRSQIAQQINPSVEQNKFNNQIGRLVSYLEHKFDEIKTAQQPKVFPAANYNKEPMPVFESNDYPQEISRFPDQYQTAANFEKNLSENNREVIDENSHSEEDEIKELGDHYAAFLTELRNDCVRRIKNFISVESEKIVSVDDLSLKKMIDVIFYIVDKEKTRFQEILKDINGRIFLVLEDTINRSQGKSKEALPLENDPVNRRFNQKVLLKQINEIQGKLNSNLAKQYQFYGRKRSSI